MNPIDLRSDTVTQPTEAMKAAMFAAPLGDDVFGDDPSVNALEEKAALLFKKEAALFCSSGTQTNQIAIKVHTQPGEELICDRLSHIYNYEGGGIAFNSGVQVRYVFGEQGIFKPQDVLENINPDNVHFPRTKLVCLENTVNKGGGKIWELTEMQAIKKVCEANNLILHLDGARIFNAIVEKKYTTQQLGDTFDTISICLSKGLGAPVGSLLIGSKDFIYHARRIRKVFGGGMRQAGLLAAAGTFALENNIERLSEDHRRAKILATEIKALNYVADVLPAESNIVIFKVKADVDENKLIDFLAQHHIKTVTSGAKTIRFVTHLSISDDDVERLVAVLKKYS